MSPDEWWGIENCFLSKLSWDCFLDKNGIFNLMSKFWGATKAKFVDMDFLFSTDFMSWWQCHLLGHLICPKQIFPSNNFKYVKIPSKFYPFLFHESLLYDLLRQKLQSEVRVTTTHVFDFIVMHCYSRLFLDLSGFFYLYNVHLPSLIKKTMKTIFVW